MCTSKSSVRSWDEMGFVLGLKFDYFVEFRGSKLFFTPWSSWGRSSYGRALASHARGTGFDSPRLHFVLLVLPF